MALTKIGKVAFCIGLYNNKKKAMRLLHPIGFIIWIIAFFTTPFCKDPESLRPKYNDDICWF